MSTEAPAAPEAPAVAIKYSKREKGGWWAETEGYTYVIVEKGWIFPTLPSGRWDARWRGLKGYGDTRDEAVRDLIRRHGEKKQALQEAIAQLPGR